MKLKINHRPTDELIPYARNARTHSETQVAQIAASIAEFGFVNPVLIGDDGVIIAGHGRLLAAQKLGMTEVPTIALGHLNKMQRKALVIADNRIAENAGWDAELLKLELAELDADEFDLDLLGFGEAEIEKMLADLNEPDEELDQLPGPEAVPISKPGDLWILGDHRLLCGDSTVLSDVEKVMDGSLADMVFTDPPYNVDYGNSAKDKMRKKDRKIMNDNLGGDFAAFLYDACVNMLAVNKGATYICMSSSELHTLQHAFCEAGGKWSTFIVWAKNTFTLGRSDYQRQYEPILYGWREGNDHYWCGARDQSDVWFFDKPQKNDLHPTMKPVALVEKALRNSSKSRDIVLDLFGGSGTTLIAAERLARQARLIELDPKYVDVIIKRWEKITGKKAIHAENGEEFATMSP